MTSSASRTRLNREVVLEAAVRLADREGVEALTVRRLADDLGVHPTSLYNHVASKEAILDGVVERLFAEGELPPGALSWQDWVRELARRSRDLARAHPGAFMVLTRRPAETPEANALSELGLEAFLRGGFSTVEAVHAVKGVSLALLGLALNECPPMGDWVQPDPEDALDDEFPRLAQAAREIQQAGIDADGHWDLVVEALVKGLRRPRTR